MNFFRKRLSLFRHSIALGVTLIVSATFVYIDAQNDTSLNNQKMQAIIDSFADNIDQQLTAWRLSMDALSVSTSLTEPYDVKNFAMEARRFGYLTGTNLSFFRADENGLLLIAHTQVPDRDLPKFYPWDKISTFYNTVREVERTGEAAVTDFFVGPIAGELIASIIIAKSHDGDSRELLSLNFNSHELSKVLARVRLPDNYIVGLVDDKGVIGARSENYQAFVGKSIPKETLNAYQAHESGSIQGVAVNGAAYEQYRLFFRRLKEAKAWTVSLLVPSNLSPSISVGPLSLSISLVTLLATNALAWAFGSAQRQKSQLEDAHKRSTHRLLNELPGAVLRGEIRDGHGFHVSLAFGQLASTLIVDGVFRFERQLVDRLSDLWLDRGIKGAPEFDLSEGGHVFRVYLNPSNLDSRSQNEYNLYVLDITHQRDAEATAIMSVRLAALGQMSATLAHEMSQPINVIAMAAENADALIGDHDIGAARHKIRKIRDFALKSRKLIDNLLIFARGDRDELAPVAVDLRRAIELAQELTQPLWRQARIEFNLEFNIDHLNVMARPIELQNIFLNLIVNSVDAFNQQAVERPIIGISAVSHNGTVTIYFRDNARGISNDILDHIFEPFVTTKSIGHGTGLGLAFVIGHLRAWGGEISARNIADGAEFEIKMVAENKSR